MDGLTLPGNETGSMCWLVSLLTALAAPGDDRIIDLFEATDVGVVLDNMVHGKPPGATGLLKGMWTHGQHDAAEYFLTSCPRYGFQTERAVTRTYVDKPQEKESFTENQKVESLAHFGRQEFKLSEVFPREEVTKTESCEVRTVTTFIGGPVLIFTTDPDSTKNIEFEPEVQLNGSTYKLLSVIVWRGMVRSGGHYAAYVYRGQKWHFCDDGHVRTGSVDDTPETFPVQGAMLYAYAPDGYKPQYRNNATGEVVTLETREELDAHKAKHGAEGMAKSPWAPSRHGTFFLYMVQK